MTALENSTVRRDIRSYEWDKYDEMELGFDDEDEEVFEDDESDE